MKKRIRKKKKKKKLKAKKIKNIIIKTERKKINIDKD